MSPTLRVVIELSRPHNSLIPIVLVYIGALVSNADTSPLVITLTVLFFLHCGINILNDVEDFSIDTSNGNKTGLQTQVLSIQKAKVLGYIASLAPLVIAAFLLDPVTVVTLLFLALISFSYNSVLYLSRRPIASLIALGLCYGSIPFWIGLSIGNEGISTTTIALGIFFGINRISLSMLKDYKDAIGDAAHNKKTFLLVYGRTAVRRVSVIVSSVSYIGILTCIALLTSENIYFLILATAVASFFVYERTLLHPDKSYAQLNALFHLFLRQQLLFDILLVIWLTTSLAS